MLLIAILLLSLMERLNCFMFLLLLPTAMFKHTLGVAPAHHEVLPTAVAAVVVAVLRGLVLFFLGLDVGFAQGLGGFLAGEGGLLLDDVQARGVPKAGGFQAELVKELLL